MSRRHKRTMTHAAIRHMQRSADALDFTELARRVRQLREIEFIQRQTCSRSLIRTKGDSGYIYAIINRPKRSIITVLTEDQAAEQLRGQGRELPEHPINTT